MSEDDSAGDNSPATTHAAPPTNHTTLDAITVRRTHHITADGIDTTTTLDVPPTADAVTEPIAHQLHHAFDVDPDAHDLDVVAPTADGGTEWTAGRNAASRASEGER